MESAFAAEELADKLADAEVEEFASFEFQRLRLYYNSEKSHLLVRNADRFALVRSRETLLGRLSLKTLAAGDMCVMPSAAAATSTADLLRLLQLNSVLLNSFDTCFRGWLARGVIVQQLLDGGKRERELRATPASCFFFLRGCCFVGDEVGSARNALLELERAELSFLRAQLAHSHYSVGCNSYIGAMRPRLAEIAGFSELLRSLRLQHFYREPRGSLNQLNTYLSSLS